jgi:hypothetical protein
MTLQQQQPPRRDLAQSRLCPQCILTVYVYSRSVLPLTVPYLINELSLMES